MVKKRTPKQIAATKKLIAFNKKRRSSKKRKSVKRVGTSQTKRSMATGKKPTKRLKKRRVSNVKKGYYPNPVKPRYALTLKASKKGLIVGLEPGILGYWDGRFFDTDKKAAVTFYSTAHLSDYARATLPSRFRGKTRNNMYEVHYTRV